MEKKPLGHLMDHHFLKEVMKVLQMIEFKFRILFQTLVQITFVAIETLVFLRVPVKLCFI